MAQHITRKELKKDEIRETLAHGAEAVASHQQQIWIYGGILLLVVVGGARLALLHPEPDARASAAFGDAMKIYSARIRAVGEPAQPDEITYVDEKNKYSGRREEICRRGRSLSAHPPGADGALLRRAQPGATRPQRRG